MLVVLVATARARFVLHEGAQVLWVVWHYVLMRMDPAGAPAEGAEGVLVKSDAALTMQPVSAAEALHQLHGHQLFQADTALAVVDAHVRDGDRRVARLLQLLR